MNSRTRMQVYRTMHLWHWISAAVCLAALLLFTITGLTRNHAAAIGAAPVVTSREATLPAPLRTQLASAAAGQAVPADVEAWIDAQFGLSLGHASAEWSPEELYVSAPGP